MSTTRFHHSPKSATRSESTSRFEPAVKLPVGDIMKLSPPPNNCVQRMLQVPKASEGVYSGTNLNSFLHQTNSQITQNNHLPWRSVIWMISSYLWHLMSEHNTILHLPRYMRRDVFSSEPLLLGSDHPLHFSPLITNWHKN